MEMDEKKKVKNGKLLTYILSAKRNKFADPSAFCVSVSLSYAYAFTGFTVLEFLVFTSVHN